MSNTILLKRSAVQGHTPTTLQMSIGEAAVNTYDGKMFLRGNNGTDFVGVLGAHTYSGDATGTATGIIGETIALTLANVASAGTYTQVVVNTKGLVTSGSALGSSSVLTALGYTPVNKAGDTMSGALTNASGFVGPLTGNVTGNASTASAWAAAMTLATSGDATGSGSFTGASPTTIALTLANTGVTAGTYTSYVVNSKGLVTSGVNLTATGDATGTASGSGIALTLANVVTAGTFTKVYVNAKGLVTMGGSIVSSDVTTALGYTPVNTATLGVANGIATLNSSGVVPYSQLPSGLVGAVEYQGTWNAATNTPSLNPTTAGAAGNYWVVSTAGTTSLTGVIGTLNSWTPGDIVIADGTAWGKIDGNPTEVLSVNGMTGAVTVSTITGNAGTASKWAAAMTFAASGDATGSTSFDGSTATTIALTLANSGVTAGTYNNVTVNTKGLVTSASNISYLLATGGTLSGALTDASGFIGPLTGNVTGNASTASAWAAAMTLVTSGDATGSGSFTGASPTTIALTLANTGVAAGTYTSYIVNSKGLVSSGINMTFTGDATGTAINSGASLTLATVNSNVGTWNTVVVNGKGLVTSASNTSYLLSTGGTLSGALTDASGFIGPLTGNASTATKWAAAMTLAHSGDVTGTGSFDGSSTTTIAMTLANTGVTAGTYTSYVVNAKGLVTSGVNLSATGDATGTASGSGIALTLAASGVTAGTYIGFTVNAKGLLTSITLPTTVAGFGITDGLTVNSTIDGGSF